MWNDSESWVINKLNIKIVINYQAAKWLNLEYF